MRRMTNEIFHAPRRRARRSQHTMTNFQTIRGHESRFWRTHPSAIFATRARSVLDYIHAHIFSLSFFLYAILPRLCTPPPIIDYKGVTCPCNLSTSLQLIDRAGLGDCLAALVRVNVGMDARIYRVDIPLWKLVGSCEIRKVG